MDHVVQTISSSIASGSANRSVVTSKHYIDSMIADIAEARKRIVVLALLVSHDGETAGLFSALEGALARGVEVRITVDEYYLRLYFAGRASRLRETQEKLDHLRACGANVTRLKAASLHPFKGRCHSKITVIDDVVYSFGGTNIADKAVYNNDFMIRVCSRDVAGRLYQLCLAIETGEAKEDFQFPLDEGSLVLVDGGKPGKSIIYNKACELAARSRRVYYVSQFCPTGPLVRLLRSADTKFYFNRSAASAPHIGAMLTIDKAIGRIRTSYRGYRYLHAKLMLVELDDGSRVLLSGSHNFKNQGVKYGTQEIALYSSDPALWNALYAYVSRDVG